MAPTTRRQRTEPAKEVVVAPLESADVEEPPTKRTNAAAARKVAAPRVPTKVAAPVKPKPISRAKPAARARAAAKTDPLVDVAPPQPEPHPAVQLEPAAQKELDLSASESSEPPSDNPGPTVGASDALDKPPQTDKAESGSESAGSEAGGPADSRVPEDTEPMAPVSKPTSAEKPVKLAKASSKPAAAVRAKKVTRRPAVPKDVTFCMGRQETDLLNFFPQKVINESSLTKSITFQGVYNDRTAVVRLEKMPFDEEDTHRALCNTAASSSCEFINDVYSSHLMHPGSGPMNNVKATLIYPASDEVLAKYTHAESTLFSETPEVYTNVVEPYIANKLTNEKDYNNWVYNILEGKSEQDRIILNDPDPQSGFVLLPDLKWTGDHKDLNLLAICHRHDIRSMRDLNDKTMILLKNILMKGTKAINDKFKNVKGSFRPYIHYHPSFYHFHVHFKLIDPSNYLASDRDHLLSNVINNINMNKDYYKKSTLTYPLMVGTPLHQELKKSKRV